MQWTGVVYSVHKIALEHPLMAARLKQYADDFDFDKLLLILEDPEKQL